MRYLPVNTIDVDEAISVVVRVVELDIKFLDSVFEVCDLVVWRTWMSVKHESGWRWTHLNFVALREGN